MLIDRAASKFAGSPRGLVTEAKEALTKAGSWKDEVRIDVWMNKPYAGKRCARLLHGVPSPRYWASSVKNIVQMPAKDVVYFFGANGLFELLSCSVPEFHTQDHLAQWLGNFSSIRFENQLICASIEHVVHLEARSPHWSKRLVHLEIARITVEIDKHAWFTKQRSMTVANSAPVWRPSAAR
ncbi:hypothetical protein [Pseudomonas lini]